MLSLRVSLLRIPDSDRKIVGIGRTTRYAQARMEEVSESEVNSGELLRDLPLVPTPSHAYADTCTYPVL